MGNTGLAMPLYCFSIITVSGSVWMWIDISQKLIIIQWFARWWNDTLRKRSATPS